MNVTQIVSSVRRGLPIIVRRNIGILAPALQKASDPIQQLFVDKLREYKQKSEANNGKVVDPTPELERELAAELDKVTKQFGGAVGADMAKFPQFNFKEPEVDPIDMPQS